jgi:molybdopterin molybdotransferase
VSGFVGLGRAEIVLPEEMVSFDAHRHALLAYVAPLEPLDMKVMDALGLLLAEDVVATEPLPGFANSAMDGYALRAADVADATVDTPVSLQVTGEVAAGDAGDVDVREGVAVRIMTGAPVPPGADTIVPVERTSEVDGGRRVAVHVAAAPGDNVRPVGVDVAAGTTVLRSGTRIGPADVALLSALGRPLVQCIPSPRVVVLSTGSELVPRGRRPGPGQLRDSNGPMVQALVRETGALPYAGGIVVDDPRALREALDSSTGHADLIVTTGGVSAGAHDHLESVVRALGEAHPRKVAMRPGMPQLYGRVGDTPIICLPGNPVSSYVSFEMFVRPVIRRLQGRSDLDRPRLEAVMTEAVTAPPHKRAFVRVRLERVSGDWRATPTGHQGSHVLSSLARADGLAVVPETVDEAPAGSRLVVHLLVD